MNSSRLRLRRLERRPSLETTDLVSDGLTLSSPSDFAFDDFEEAFELDDCLDPACEGLDLEGLFLDACFDPERELDFLVGTAFFSLPPSRR